MPFDATLYFYSTTFKREMHFLLYYIILLSCPLINHDTTNYLLSLWGDKTPRLRTTGLNNLIIFKVVKQ